VATPPIPTRLEPAHALVGLVLLFFWPAVSLQGVYFHGDASHYLPRLAWTAEQLHAGRFPLWSPHLSLGGPHAANAATMGFYPPHLLLFFALPAHAAYDWDVVLHVLLAALGTYALARAWGQTGAAAILAGTVYGLGGFTLVHVQHLNILVALAWVPVVFFFTERFLERRGGRDVGLAALALGLQLLGGHPQMVLYGVLALGTYVAFRLVPLFRARDPDRVRVLLGLGALLPLALALAAVFLLPFAEWTRFVSVADRFGADEAGRIIGGDPARFSLRPRQLVLFLAPFWYGGSQWRPRFGDQLVEFTAYVGVLSLALAVVGVAGRERRTTFLGGLALVALLLSLGGHGPLFPLLARLPVVGWGRTPVRYLMLVELATALLAGFGLDALRAGRGRRTALVLGGAIIVMAVAAAGLSLLPRPSPDLLFGRLDRVSLAQPDTRVLLATLAGTGALLGLLAGRASSEPRLLGLAIAFAAGELLAFRSHLFFIDLAPKEVYSVPSPAAAAIRASGDPPRFYGWFRGDVKSSALLYERLDLEAYRARLRDGIANGLPMSFGLQSFAGSGLEPLPHRQLVYVVSKRDVFDSRSATLVGLFGGRYVIGRKGVTAPELTLLQPGTVNVYRNERALPRAYLAAASRVVDDDRAAFTVVKRPDFDPRETVVIERPGPDRPPGPLGHAEARIVDEEPNRLVVETAVERPAWLVLNDTFAPGWRASVDGEPAPVFRANALVRAVPVDAGRHRVEFVYAPASVRTGAMLSFLALLATGVLVFHPRTPVTAREDLDWQGD
jgi:hypothetical protein